MYIRIVCAIYNSKGPALACVGWPGPGTGIARSMSGFALDLGSLLKVLWG